MLFARIFFNKKQLDVVFSQLEFEVKQKQVFTLIDINGLN